MHNGERGVGGMVGVEGGEEIGVGGLRCMMVNGGGDGMDEGGMDVDRVVGSRCVKEALKQGDCELKWG